MNISVADLLVPISRGMPFEVVMLFAKPLANKFSFFANTTYCFYGNLYFGFGN